MHQAKKVNLNHEFSFLVNSQENSNFLALNSKSSGLYIDYKNLKNIDFGGYVMGEFGGMSLKNTLHMGSHEESISNLGEYKNRFLLLKSELGKTFKAGSWTVSPKIMGGYQQFLSLEGLMAEGDDDFHIESTSKGLFYAGIGADITAKFSSLEAFASLNLLHKNNSGVSLVRDDGESFSNSSGFKSEVTFGVHANVDKNSNLYGHMKLVQGVDHLFEVGMKVSFCD
jgi:outer membrane autotransporter protein